jgi:AraC-like DNA-binding protein
MEEQKAVSEVEGKDVAEVSDEELATLMAEGKKLQEAENAGDGVKADYILLAKSGTKALKKTQTDLYIEGLKIGDFFLQKEKKILGEKLRVVPLAFITLYQEKASADKDAQFFGIWNKEQAETYELVDGSYYDRQLPNGHILQPVNWVMVEVLGHPELENAVIAYKSTGSRIWRKWKDDAKPRAQTSATLIYEISEMVGYRNVKHFMKVFKKIEGKTPSEYRENLLLQ